MQHGLTDEDVRVFCDQLLEENEKLKNEIDIIKKQLYASRGCAMCQVRERLNNENKQR